MEEKRDGEREGGRGGRARLPWGPFSIAFLGMAFARAWVSLVFVVPGTTAPCPALSHDLFDLAYVATSVAAAVFARHLVPLAARRCVFPATLGGMMLASLAFVTGPYAPQAIAGTVALVSSLLGGAAFLGCTLLNAEALAGVSILRIALYASGYNLLGSVLVFFLEDGGFVRTGVAVFLLPVVAVVLVQGALTSLPERDRQHADYPRYRFPWKLIALFALFSFVYGLRSESLAQGAGRHASLSTALVAGAVLLAAYFFPQRFDVARLCRAPLPIMVCGLLLLPTEGLFGQVVSSYLVSGAFSLMTLLVSILLFDMSKRTGVAIVPLMAAKCSTQACMFAGTFLSGHFDVFASGSGSAAMTGVVCAALAVAFFLLFSERDLTERFGIKILGEGSLAAGERRVSGLLARCGDLTRLYRLTPREEEVLREMAQRKGSKEIMRNLAIAPGTLKAHTRHIYEKMGIHTREDLYALLEVEEGESWPMR